MDKPLGEQLFAIGTELAETLLVKLKNTPFAGLTEHRRAMLFFFCKAYKTYQAIELLWKSGYTEDATNLARSIYEIRLQVMFMSCNPTARSKQFIDHWFKSGVGILQILRRLFPNQRADLDEGEKNIREGVQGRAIDPFADLDAAEKAVKAKWWGPTGIKGLLRELGLEREHEVIYSQLSEHSHSGSNLLSHYVRLSEDSITINYRPARPTGYTVPLSATEWLSQVIGFTGRSFELNFDTEVDRGVEKARTALAAHEGARPSQ